MSIIKPITKNFTQVPTEYITGEKMLDKDKLTILTLILMTKSNKDTCLFNISWICNVLKATTTNTRRVKAIKDTIREFQEQGILYLSSDILGREKLDMDKCKMDSSKMIFAETYDKIGKFTYIYDEDIIDIIDYCHNNKMNTSGMIYLYLHITSYINEKKYSSNYKLCYPSIERLIITTGLSRSAVLRYRKILKDLKIINHDYLGLDTTQDELKSTKTYYCRFEDSHLLKDKMNALNCEWNMQKLTNFNKEVINTKRSIKQKINNINKKQALSDQEKVFLLELQSQYASL